MSDEPVGDEPQTYRGRARTRREVPCPRCGVAAGEACTNGERELAYNHPERVQSLIDREGGP